MRVLWFVNSLFPALCRRLGLPERHTGSWMTALAERLKQQPEVQLAVASATPFAREFQVIQLEGISYCCFPLRWGRVGRSPAISAFVRKVACGVAFLRTPTEAQLEDLVRVAEYWQPDLIVVHGTEHFYGLVAPRVKCPVLISVQGILDVYLQHYWGELHSIAQRVRCLDAVAAWARMKKLVGVERAVFTANRYFLGRTLWDKSHVLRLNPEATYYYCPEMLRPEFYQASWHLERAQRCLIYTTTTPQFYKGTACLVRALALLERQFPQVRLVIGGPLLGTGVGRYLQRLAQRLRVTGRIEWEGYLGAGRIVKQLEAAHVYVLPSHIENSPNSLTEAQMVGVPCVASYAGGIPSLVQDGESGLLFNVGDPAVLAMNVCRVFEDDLLAERLSRTARERAACRHDPAHVMRTQLEIYQRLLSAGPK